MTQPPNDQVTVLPPRLDLNIYAGDDFFLDLIVTNPDGTDADLTDASPAAQVRGRPDEDPPITEFDITVDKNVLHLHLLAQGSAALPSVAVWDCQIQTPYTTTLVRGDVKVTAEVTRPEPVLPPEPPDNGGAGGNNTGGLYYSRRDEVTPEGEQDYDPSQVMPDEDITGGVG